MEYCIFTDDESLHFLNFKFKDLNFFLKKNKAHLVSQKNQPFSSRA